MNDRRSIRFALALFLLLSCAVLPALAVSDGAPQSRGQLLAGSARGSAMGEMTTILDDGAVAIWWNPGMLALDRRSQLNGTVSNLAEGLADDIHMRVFGLHGGIFRPRFGMAAGLGWTWLDLGSSDIINEEGERLGSFSSADHLINLAGGVSFLDAFGLGLALEYTYSRLSPPIPELGIDDATGTALSVSFGAAVRPEIRFTTDGSGVTLGRGWQKPAFVLTPIFALSVLHLGTDITYNDQSQPEELPRQLHLGGGLRVGFDPGEGIPAGDLARLLRFDLLLGAEYDKSLVGSKDQINHYGLELRLFGIFSVRYGKVDDEVGWIVDNTWGFGLGLEELLPFGARIDYASVPQAEDLPRVDRWEAMISLRPRDL